MTIGPMVIGTWEQLQKLLNRLWGSVRGELPDKWWLLPAATVLDRLWALALLDQFWPELPPLRFIETHAKRERPRALCRRAGTSLSTIERLRRGAYIGRPRADTWFKIVFGLGFAVPFLANVNEYISENCRSTQQQRVPAQEEEVSASATAVDRGVDQAPSERDDGTRMLDDGTSVDTPLRVDGTGHQRPLRDDGTPVRDDGAARKVRDDTTIRPPSTPSSAYAPARRRAVIEEMVDSLGDALAVAFAHGCSKRHVPETGEKPPSNFALTGAPVCYVSNSSLDLEEGAVDGEAAMSGDDDNGKLVHMARPIFYEGEEGFFVKRLPTQLRRTQANDRVPPHGDDRVLQFLRQTIQEVAVMQLQGFGAMQEMQREEMRREREAHREERRQDREERRQERERNDARADAYQAALTKMTDIAAAVMKQREAPPPPRRDLGGLGDLGEVGARLLSRVMKELGGVAEGEGEESDG